MRQVLNRCPVCGGPLYVKDFCQYTRNYKIGKKGKELKHFTKTDNGSIGSFQIACEKAECFFTNVDLEIECPKDMRINSHVKYGSNNEFILVTEEGE